MTSVAMENRVCTEQVYHYDRRPFCFTGIAVVDFFFFQRLISEVAWPIVIKLCHVFDGDPRL